MLVVSSGKDAGAMHIRVMRRYFRYMYLSRYKKMDEQIQIAQ